MSDHATSVKLARPQVKFPPPALYGFAILLGWLFNFLVPVGLPFRSWMVGVGCVGVAIGLSLIVWSATEFRRHNTTILPHKASSRIIQSGPFRFSRNPIYLAFAIIQISFALLLNSIWVLLLVPVCIAITNVFVIAKEEAFLTQAFGEEYIVFMQKVRRWV